VDGCVGSGLGVDILVLVEQEGGGRREEAIRGAGKERLVMCVCNAVVWIYV
jgi:hypothetical protein